MRIEGGCHCGKVRFEAEADPEKAGICHCTDCGSRLWAAAEHDPQMFNLRLGTVRQRAQLAPKSQVWCSSALPWAMSLGAVKQHAKQAG